MKNQFFLTALLLFILSCSKESTPTPTANQPLSNFTSTLQLVEADGDTGLELPFGPNLNQVL